MNSHERKVATIAHPGGYQMIDDLDLTAAFEAGAAGISDDWNPERDPVLSAMFRDYAQSAIDAALPHIREALAQQVLAGRGDVDPAYADIQAEALREAADALDNEGLRLKPGGWGSNPADQQTSRFALSVLEWLRIRADKLDGGKS